MPSFLGNAICILLIAALVFVCARNLYLDHVSGGCAGCSGSCSSCGHCGGSEVPKPRLTRKQKKMMREKYRAMHQTRRS